VYWFLTLNELTYYAIGELDDVLIMSNVLPVVTYILLKKKRKKKCVLRFGKSITTLASILAPASFCFISSCKRRAVYNLHLNGLLIKSTKLALDHSMNHMCCD